MEYNIIVGGTDMKKINIEELNQNLIHKIHMEWPLLTLQDINKVNAMTVNWVQMGWLWNKPVVSVYVRPQRHTFSLINQTNFASLAFLTESYRKELSYLGSASGRSEDKLARCNFTTVDLDQTPIIEQAQLVLTLKKLHQYELKADQFIDQTVIDKSYPDHDFHVCYVFEIIGAYQK